MRTSEQIDKVAEALALAQAEFKYLLKNKKANYGMYADLAAVIEATNDALHGQSLCVSQSPAFVGGRINVVTRLIHKTGQWLENEVSLKPGQDTPHGVGSAITYGRRYGLCALLGICADDDDDGQHAQPQQQHKAIRPEDVWNPKNEMMMRSVMEMCAQVGMGKEHRDEFGLASKLVGKSMFEVEEIIHSWAHG